MPSYLVETYLSRRDAGRRAERDVRAREAAEELTEGPSRVRVRFERSIYLPEDETCFFVFVAPSSRVAALVAERAELGPIRIVEAISSHEHERRHTRPRTTTSDSPRRNQ